MNLLYLTSINYGSKRRNEIKNWFLENQDGAIAVNKKWQANMKYDKDLQKLIKSGFLKRVRDIGFVSKRGAGWKKSGANQTYLKRS